MRPARRVSTLLLLLVACSVGTTGRNYAPAQGPAGATVTLKLSGQDQAVGELLAVEDTALLVLEGRGARQGSPAADHFGKGAEGVVHRPNPDR